MSCQAFFVKNAQPRVLQWFVCPESLIADHGFQSISVLIIQAKSPNKSAGRSVRCELASARLDLTQGISLYTPERVSISGPGDSGLDFLGGSTGTASKQISVQFSGQALESTSWNEVLWRKEAPPGFEPGSNGFAIRRLRPLGYGALKLIEIHNKLLSERSLLCWNYLINRSDRVIIRRFFAWIWPNPNNRSKLGQAKSQRSEIIL